MLAYTSSFQAFKASIDNIDLVGLPCYSEEIDVEYFPNST